MMDRAQRLAVELYEIEITSPLDPPEDVLASWQRFERDLTVAGEVLDVFEEDEEAARTVRDRLCAWARIWARWHPNPYYRPWYGEVARAAEAGDWDEVSWLCQELMEVEQRWAQR
jgi:hypothetical protein